MDKVPKGTRDSLPETEKLRQVLIAECEQQFLLYDAKRMDTPIFEIYSTLMEKYNNEENMKEVYVLENKNNNGEKCALRYDLSVPFSRYAKTNRVQEMRRYQVGKVFRRDNPSPGRYREFYQCDYDCLGDNIKWATDAETLSLLNKILTIFKNKYNLPNYTIRINSREILSDMLEACDIPKELFISTCISIDKLDKCEWKIVARELEEKGLTKESIDKLETILRNNERQTLSENRSLSDYNLDFVKKETRENIEKILESVVNYQIDVPVVLDLKIARGLNYYTGLIFEVRLNDLSEVSIAAGGRYDNLCPSPCVGFSLGIDRILNYVSYKFEPTTKVWVISLKSSNEEKLFIYRLRIVNKLRENNISVGTDMKLCNPNKSMTRAIKADIPYIIFLGDDELNNKTLTLKNISQKTQVTVSFEEVLYLLQ